MREDSTLQFSKVENNYSLTVESVYCVLTMIDIENY